VNTELQITEEKGYLMVQLTGVLSLEIVQDTMRSIVAACDENNCFKVLVEAHLTNPLGVMENYIMPQVFKEAGVTHKHKIAWVKLNAGNYEDAHFAETVLHNQGYSMAQLFRDAEEGKRWLLDLIA
jgi:hypothetical protein